MNESILITGAGRGVGLALADRFCAGGYRVFAGTHRTYEYLTQYKQKYSELLFVIPLDVTEMNSIQAAAAKVANKTAALDILINNAGVYLEDKTAPLEDLNLENGHLQKTMEVNAFGPLRVTQQFLPLLEKGQRKTIINISSEAGSIGNCRRKQEFAYCMSKAALNMQTRILHNYLYPRGFRIKALHPGWVRTDMGGKEATLSPGEAAGDIFQVIEHVIARTRALSKKNNAGQDLQEIFLDYQGKPLRW